MRRVLVGLTILIGLLAIVVRAYERWYFPRDPHRDVDPLARVVSPADGRIVYVARVEHGTVPIAVKNRRRIPLDEIVKGDNRPPAGTLIGIFMSPLDVHYQRSPIAGVVSEVTYHPAAFNHVMGSMFLRNLVGAKPFHEKSPHIYANERNVIRIHGNELTAFVVQIADQQVNKIDRPPHEAHHHPVDIEIWETGVQPQRPPWTDWRPAFKARLQRLKAANHTGATGRYYSDD